MKSGSVAAIAGLSNRPPPPTGVSGSRAAAPQLLPRRGTGDGGDRGDSHSIPPPGPLGSPPKGSSVSSAGGLAPAPALNCTGLTQIVGQVQAFGMDSQSENLGQPAQLESPSGPPAGPEAQRVRARVADRRRRVS